MQQAVLRIATREETGEHDQSLHAVAITALLLGGALAAPAAAEESKPIQTGAAS